MASRARQSARSQIRQFSARILKLHAQRLAIDREVAAAYAEARTDGLHLAVRAEVNRRRKAIP